MSVNIKSIFKSIISAFIIALLLTLVSALALGAVWLMFRFPYVSNVILLGIIVFMVRKEK